MKIGDTLTREDGAVFRCMTTFHWCDIIRDYDIELHRRGYLPGPRNAESDSVKWIGGDYYVGATSGWKYTLDPR
jgi:hypothetical protein